MAYTRHYTAADIAYIREMMEEAMRRKASEMPGSNNDQRREKVDPKTGHKFKNLNHPIPKRDVPLQDKVAIHSDEYAGHGVYHVTLPRRGRLGDTRICDERGRPLNIGPTYQHGNEFPTMDLALERFRRVSGNFDKLNGIGVQP